MAAQFQFVMRSGPSVGKVYPLDVQEVSIGRDASNTVAINDAEISRKHAKMELRSSAYVIQDLGSTNGTFVNGQRISGAQVLNPGDSVGFGENIVLSYEAGFDPNATVMGPAKRAKTAAPVQRPAPAPAPAPTPAYSGQVPASPAAAAPAKKGNTKVILIVVGVVVLCSILSCIAVLLFVDADPTGARWCNFPFSILARMLGGVCP